MLYGEFLAHLVPYIDEIMSFCLGEYWKEVQVFDGRIPINKALDINIKESDLLSYAAKTMKQKYVWLFCYDRHREVLTEKTHKLFRINRDDT